MRRLTDRLTVSEQISADDLEALKAAGVSVIVNNRPDGEEPGQPEDAVLRAAAEALGLTWVSAPFRGRPTAEAVEALRTALEGDGSVHAFCRSGTRSTYAWAVMAVQDGAEIDRTAASARAAGYDVAPLFF